MAKVWVEPAGVHVEVMPHESLAEAAWRLGFHWPTRCYGQADCMLCFVTVIDGEVLVLPATDEELDQMRTHLPRRLHDPRTRLACRLRVRGDGVIVFKKGVRPPPASCAPSTQEPGEES